MDLSVDAVENETKSLLKRLSEASGVSGYEMDVGKIIFDELEEHVDWIETDNFGNVISLKKASARDGPKIMLAARALEIKVILHAPARRVNRTGLLV